MTHYCEALSTYESSTAASLTDVRRSTHSLFTTSEDHRMIEVYRRLIRPSFRCKAFGRRSPVTLSDTSMIPHKRTANFSPRKRKSRAARSKSKRQKLEAVSAPSTFALCLLLWPFRSRSLRPRRASAARWPSSARARPRRPRRSSRAARRPRRRSAKRCVLLWSGR